MGCWCYDSNNGGIFAKEFTPTDDGIEVMWATHVLGMCSQADQWYLCCILVVEDTNPFSSMLEELPKCRTFDGSMLCMVQVTMLLRWCLWISWRRQLHKVARRDGSCLQVLMLTASRTKAASILKPWQIQICKNWPAMLFSSISACFYRIVHCEMNCVSVFSHESSWKFKVCLGTCRFNAYQAYGQSKTGDILLARLIGQQLKVWINPLLQCSLLGNTSYKCRCYCLFNCKFNILVFSGCCYCCS